MVLLGKCGVGKSSIANQLVGYDPLSSKKPPFQISMGVFQSVTREISHKIMRFQKENIEYEITVIDTVGLFDTNSGFGGRRNPAILDEIEAYLKDRFTGVNILLFVFRKGPLTPEEKSVFSFVEEKFVKEISPISALVITNCENLTPNARDDIVEEFRRDRNTKNIADRMEKGIYPVGFPDIKTMLPTLQRAYTSKMTEDRDTLLDLICQAEKLHLTKKLYLEKVKPVLQEASNSCTLQ